MSSLLAEITDYRPKPAQAELGVVVSVLVFAKDPISRAGVTGQLRAELGITVLEAGDGRHPDLGIVVVDGVDNEVLRLIRTIRRNGLSRILVIAAVIDHAVVTALSEAGANGLVARSGADRRRLAAAIRHVHRGNLLFPVVDAGPSEEPAETCVGGDDTLALSDRGRDVLRLLADGYDTGEIARRLAYSEPTIKNVIQRLFEQLKARNRPHAVAVALRAGLI